MAVYVSRGSTVFLRALKTSGFYKREKKDDTEEVTNFLVG